MTSNEQSFFPCAERWRWAAGVFHGEWIVPTREWFVDALGSLNFGCPQAAVA